MACYILSDNTRIYAVAEAQYGVASPPAADKRLPFLDFSVKTTIERPRRLERSGGRTFNGWPANTRKKTAWQCESLLVRFDPSTANPAYHLLFTAAMGAPALRYGGGTLGGGSTSTELHFSGSHGLSPEQAVVVRDELRFVDAVLDPLTVVLNAPLSITPVAGEAVKPAVTYKLGESLPSIGLFEYRTPSTGYQRLLNGCVVDSLRLTVNGDYHEFIFRGPALGCHPEALFQPGTAGLSTFPVEPYDASMRFEPVSGNLGQAFIGSATEAIHTLTSVVVTLDNNVILRDREFGTAAQPCVLAGRRRVGCVLEMYPTTAATAASLYEALSTGSSLRVMIQLGEQAGGLCGVYMKSVAGAEPAIDLSDTRVSWKTESMRAAGTLDDELVIAFG